MSGPRHVLLRVFLAIGIAVLVWWAVERPDATSPVPEPRREIPEEGPSLAGQPADPPAPFAGPLRFRSVESVAPRPGCGSLHVTVGWPEGEVRGRTARVAVYLADGPVRRATTNAAGHADFDDLPAGRVTITARGEPPLFGTYECDIEEDNVVESHVALRSGIAIEGRVFDAVTGAPIEGALVGIPWGVDVWQARGGGPFTGRTDAEGRYEAWWVRRGPREWFLDYELAALAPGYALGLADAPDCEPGRHRVHMDFRLRPGGTVRGIVRRPDGRPAPGAQVAVVHGRARQDLAWTPDLLAMPARLLRARTGADGRYTILGLSLDGIYAVTANALGYSRAEAVGDLTPTASNPELVQDLTLRGPSAVTVRIVDAAGRPVGHVSVDCRDPFDYQGGRVDETGVLEVRFAEPGTWRVRVEPRGWPPVRHEFEVEPGRAVEHTVVLRRGVSLEGVVLDDTGQPLEGVFVDAHALDGDGKNTARSAAGGRFRITGLEPGVHRLAVRSWQGEPLGGPFGTANAPAEGLIVPAVRRGYLVVEYPAVPSVRRANGLSVRYDHGDAPVGKHVGITRSSDGASIRFVLDVPSGSRRFEFRLRDQVPFAKTVDVPPGDHVVVAGRLDPGHSLRGRVVDPQGEPVEGAHVCALDHEGVEFHTLPDGQFFLHHLAPGPATLKVRMPDGTFLPSLVEHEVVQDGDPVEITLRRGGRVVGRVLDADRKPVPGVEVVAWKLDEPVGTRFNRSVRTQATGTVELHLHPGRYAVAVWKEVANMNDLERVEVEVEEEGKVEIRLPYDGR